MCSKRLSGCGSGTEYLAVTPWGDLYPCHQFVGEEKFLLGNVLMESSVPIFVTNSVPATYTQRKNVKTVLRDSTVAAAVLQTLIISMEQLMILMI